MVGTVSRNYQLIIYVYATVGAFELTYPFCCSRMGCSAECITAHSYMRARVPTPRMGSPAGRGEGFSTTPGGAVGGGPHSYYTTLKSHQPLRAVAEIYSRFHTLLEVNSPYGELVEADCIFRNAIPKMYDNYQLRFMLSCCVMECASRA